MAKQRIGIYGSSFDPITNVHLWTANTVASREALDKVIFLPCSSMRRDKQMQTSDKDRLAMLKLAVEENPKFEVDEYEMHVLPGNHYTWFTMNHFKKKYPDAEIIFIMGADLLRDIPGKFDEKGNMIREPWKHGEELVKENKFIVMARDGIDMLEVIAKSALLRNNHRNFSLMHKGLAMEISSTYIREEFAMGGDPRYLMPDKVYKYIKQFKLYGYQS